MCLWPIGRVDSRRAGSVSKPPGKTLAVGSLGGRHNMQGHVNLSAHAADEAHLYQIWDADLKKCITRRRLYEGLAVAWVVLRLANVIHPSIEAFIAVLVGLVYMAILQFVDESNVNYLMHNGEWRQAIRSFNDARVRE